MGSRHKRRAGKKQSTEGYIRLMEAVPEKHAVASAEEGVASSMRQMHPLTNSSIKGSKDYNELRVQLGKPEPASPSAKKARFDALFRIYCDPTFNSKLNSSYVLLQSRKRGSMRAKDADAQKRASREILGMEADVALYRKLLDALNKYGSAKDQLNVKNMQRRLWRKHEEFYNYETSGVSLLGKLWGLGLDGEQRRPISAYVRNSLGRSSPQVIDLGAGSAAEKKARELEKVLKQYPQLMLNPDTVRVAFEKSDGGVAWRVELGSREQFKGKRNEIEIEIMNMFSEAGKSASPKPKSRPKKEARVETAPLPAKKESRKRTRKVKASKKRAPPQSVEELDENPFTEEALAKEKEERAMKKDFEKRKGNYLRMGGDPLEELNIDSELTDAGIGDAGAGEILGFDAGDSDKGSKKRKSGRKGKRGKKSKRRRKR